MASLQDLMDSKHDLVEYFYNETVAQMHRARNDLFSRLNLVEREHTNWRDEQRAIRQTCVLLDQSHHMPVLYVRGPDAQRLLQYLTPISLANIVPGGAKQYFACTPRGYHIGDCIMHYHGDDEGFELISGMPLLNWVRYHGENGNYDVTMEFDPITPFNPTGRRTKFRFELEGPKARDVLAEVVEDEFPELKFFRTAKVRIAGCEVMILRHGMGQAGGGEISGAYEDMDRVRSAVLKAGQKHGIQQGGTITYFSSSIVSGWVPYPLAGIYTGEELRNYREWLPADGWEANQQIGGSLRSSDIEDYYWTPSALGYDRFVKFDHDFIGREALEMPTSKPRRVRRILEWSVEDVTRIYQSQFVEELPFKSIELPTPMYGWPQADEVRSLDGALIGMSQFCGFNVNEDRVLSVCCLDEEFAEPGSEVVLTWGEPDGGSAKPHVERHAQTTIRATVCSAPYGKAAQASKSSVL